MHPCSIPEYLTAANISVIGLSDGLTVPFALTAGLSSLGESRLVILGGIAELIAGAISMGIGGFLASQSERDYYRYLRRTTRARVKRSCDGEVEREVYAVLGPVGVDQDLSRQLARRLLEVESGVDRSNGQASDAERGLKWCHTVGITEFLLKFGEGLGARLHSSSLCCGFHPCLCLIQRRSRHAAFTCLHLRSGWAISSAARSH
jgi:hypothetical protein